MKINEVQQKFASHCMTATGQTSDSERGGGGATPHGVFNQYKFKLPLPRDSTPRAPRDFNIKLTATTTMEIRQAAIVHLELGQG